MNSYFTIVKKELLDTVRDRRTLITMVVMPLLLFPLLMTGVNKFQEMQSNKEETKKLRVAVIDNNNAKGLVEDLNDRPDFNIYTQIAEADVETFVKDDSLDAAVIIDPSFDAKVADLKTGKINLIYLAKSDLNKTESRIQDIIDGYEERVISNRLRSKELKSAFIEPIRMKKRNLSSQQEQIGQTIGGILPYIFVIFSFMGCMYPAIDLFTGEKERGTIETILTAPVSRLQILLGKMTVVSLVGLVSAFLAIIGLYLSVKLSSSIPEIFQNMLSNLLTPKFMILLLLMLIPLNIFFAGVMVPVTIYSKSFKEAQSILTPLSIVLFVPIIIGMMPTIELTLATALVPILNISLASKAMIADTLQPLHYIVTIVSLIAFAMISVLVCIRWFESESNVLR